MKKIIKWLNSELPRGICIAMHKGPRCVVCWPVTITVIVVVTVAIWTA